MVEGSISKFSALAPRETSRGNPPLPKQKGEPSEHKKELGEQASITKELGESLAFPKELGEPLTPAKDDLADR